MPTIAALHQRRRELEAEIDEAKRRLPAHSAKPPAMRLLLDLEDEYDEILKAIEEMKRANMP
jgi:F0F1-type ATP synthase membrane subunit b/b'